MTRRAPPATGTTRGQERLSNCLALLALLAIGIVWPLPETAEWRHGRPRAAAAAPGQQAIRRDAATRKFPHDPCLEGTHAAEAPRAPAAPPRA